MSKADEKKTERDQDAPEEPVVDLSLLKETLCMTVEERLALNDRMARTILDLRRGFEET